MKQGLVSVVLPIYGVENYLDRCIMSIVNQTYSELEIILVDDGSRDRCPAMCDNWAKKDSRIKVIHKVNAGLGMARNTGIEHAKGEYICFFDSDDYVALDTIEKAYNLAKAEQSDIVIFGLSKVDANGNIKRTIIPQTDKVTYSGKEVQSDFLPDLIASHPKSIRKYLYVSACVCLYSMDMIRNSGWLFASEREIISEDAFSLLCLYRYVQRVSVLPEALYFYCENKISLTHTYRKDRYERICHFHQTSVNKARELGYSEDVVNRLQELFVSFLIGAMKTVLKADCSETEKKQEIKRIIKDPYLAEFAWDNSLKRESQKRNIFTSFLKKRMWRCCYVLLKLVS